jgi:hypothetical protein
LEKHSFSGLACKNSITRFENGIHSEGAKRMKEKSFADLPRVDVETVGARRQGINNGVKMRLAVP